MTRKMADGTTCRKGPGCRLHDNDADFCNEIKSQINLAKEKVKIANEPIKEIMPGTAKYNKFISSGDDFVGQLDMKEHEEIYMYTTMRFKEINQALLNGEYHPSVSYLDAALAKAPKVDGNGFRVFRGTKRDNYTIGEEVEYKAFLSTTASTKVAHEFAGDNGVIVTLTTNQVAALNDMTSEHGLREKEVLLPRNKKYVVDKIEDIDYDFGYETVTKKTIFLKEIV